MPEQLKMNLATVVTLCLAIGASAWALSGEVHNYRMRNITDRLAGHESTILAHEKELIQVRTIQLDILEGLRDIKLDIKELNR